LFESFCLTVVAKVEVMPADNWLGFASLPHLTPNHKLLRALK